MSLESLSQEIKHCSKELLGNTSNPESLTRSLIQNREDYSVMYLRETNCQFEKMFTDQHRLIATGGIEFRAKSYRGIYAKSLHSFYGIMNDDGYAKLDDGKGRMWQSPGSIDTFATKFEGLFRWDGTIEIHTSDTGLTSFNRNIPQAYKGSIGPAGEIELHLSEVGYEFTHFDQIETLEVKLLCDDSDALLTFKSNRDWLRKEIYALIESLGA